MYTPRSSANETGEIVLPNRDEEDIPIVSFSYFYFYDLMGVVGKQQRLFRSRDTQVLGPET